MLSHIKTTDSYFQAEKGGYKTYVMEVKGNRVYSKLKYESGVHRVQRVPQTEAQGRVHTSTATVAIMPEVLYIKIVATSMAYIVIFKEILEFLLIHTTDI